MASDNEIQITPQMWLGFDYGTKNIGIATAQYITCTATALPPIPSKNGVPNWTSIRKLITEWRPDALLVGTPYNMDGSKSEMMKKTQIFASELLYNFDIPVYEADERLSSFEAKEWINHRHQTGDKRAFSIDSIAAQIILESWLNTHGPTHYSPILPNRNEKPPYH